MLKSTYPMVSLLFIILLSTMALLQSDLIVIWFILEANNFAFIFLMTLEMKNKKMIFIYYLIQIMASSLIIISMLMNLPHLHPSTPMLDMMLIMGLMLKIGAPPLHSWLPMLSLFMSWNMIIILITIQKVIPFIILSMAHPHTLLQALFTLSCLILPPYLMLNCTNLKKLLVYSSINQSGWMIMISLSFSSLWLIYILTYSVSLMLINTLIKEKKMKFNMKMENRHNYTYLLMMLITMNLGSIPPLTLFLFKWYSVVALILLTESNFIIIIMLISSLMMIYLYTNMLIKISLISLPNSKLWISQSLNSPYKRILISLALVLALFMFIT